ncbi:MAG: DNA-binding response regulator [Clostridiales bacterium 38-18]|nr:MAG: DNA-binding response regulator [Clostridiales bacterium 38-18]
MNDIKERILIIEDDQQISRFINYALELEGYSTKAANNAQNGLSILVTEKIDLVLLDLGLPDFDGLEVIKRIREWSEVPIIVISARDADKEKAIALDLGADDFLTKPFSSVELMARIRVAFRHVQRKSALDPRTIFSIGELTLDMEKRLLYRGKEELHLTPLEYQLIIYLFKNIGKVITNQTLLSEIWGHGYGSDTQVLRTLMAGLRRKIEDNPAKPKYIITEIGVGYRLKDE